MADVAKQAADSATRQAYAIAPELVKEKIKKLMKAMLTNDPTSNDLRNSCNEFIKAYEAFRDEVAAEEQLTYRQEQAYLKFAKLFLGVDDAKNNEKVTDIKILSNYKSNKSNFTDAKHTIFSQKMTKKMFGLQHMYELLIDKILDLPDYTITVVITDVDGKVYPAYNETFKRWSKFRFQAKRVSDTANPTHVNLLRKNFQTLTQEYRKDLGIDFIDAFTNHYNNIYNYLNNHKAQTKYIPETIMSHFYSRDIYNNDIHSENTLNNLRENHLSTKKDIWDIWFHYHGASNTDPTNTGQDIIRELINTQVKAIKLTGNTGISALSVMQLGPLQTVYSILKLLNEKSITPDAEQYDKVAEQLTRMFTQTQQPTDEDALEAKLRSNGIDMDEIKEEINKMEIQININ